MVLFPGVEILVYRCRSRGSANEDGGSASGDGLENPSPSVSGSRLPGALFQIKIVETRPCRWFIHVDDAASFVSFFSNFNTNTENDFTFDDENSSSTLSPSHQNTLLYSIAPSEVEGTVAEALV